TALFTVSPPRPKEDVAGTVPFFMTRTMVEVIGGVRRAIYEERAWFRYVGTLSTYPMNAVAFSRYHDPTWYCGDGYCWDVVRTDTEVRKRVNAWLSAPRLQTPYELQLRHLLTIDDLQNQFWDIVTDIEEKSLSVGKYEGVEFRGDLFGQEIPSALDRLKE